MVPWTAVQVRTVFCQDRPWLLVTGGFCVKKFRKAIHFTKSKGKELKHQVFPQNPDQIFDGECSFYAVRGSVLAALTQARLCSRLG